MNCFLSGIKVKVYPVLITKVLPEQTLVWPAVLGIELQLQAFNHKLETHAQK